MVDDLEATAESSTCISWADAVDEMLASDADQFVPTNHEWFDRVYGGGLPVGLTILAGVPGAGKSALALQLGLGAVTAGKRMLWACGNETSRHRQAFQCASCHSFHWVWILPKFYMGRDDNEAEAAKKAAEYFANQAFIETNFNLNAIEAGIVQNKPDIVVIDYVQLLRSDEATRVEQLDSIAISLIEIARRHQVALVAISSMSKGSDGKSSIGSISRGTAQFDYAADLYLLAETKDGQGDEKAVQWKAMKNRRGPLVDLDLIFDGFRQHFRSAMVAAVDESLTFSGLED